MDNDIGVVIVFQQVSSDSERTIIKTNSLFDELASALENNESLPSSVQPTVDLVRGEPSGAESSQPSGPNSEKINGYNSIIPTSELENSSSARISVQAASVQHEATGTIQYLRQQTSSFAWSDDESRSALLARQPKHSVTWSTNILPLADRVIESSNIQEALRSRNEWSGLNNTDSLIGYHDGQWTHRVQLRKRLVFSITRSTICKHSPQGLNLFVCRLKRMRKRIYYPFGILTPRISRVAKQFHLRARIT